MLASDSAFPSPPVAPRARLTIFSFPLSWSLLAEYPELPMLDRSRVGPPKSGRTVMKAPAELVTIPERRPQPSRIPEPSGPDQWEMVIPKMVRPPKKLSTPAVERSDTAKFSDPLAGPGAAPAPAAATPAPVPAASLMAASDPFSTPITAPGFSLAEKLSVVLATVALLSTLLVGAVLFFSPPPPPREPVIQAGAPLPVGLAGWVNGTDPRRRVSLLRGSLSLTDFRLEFQGKIDGKALGWVFRAKDPQNFYANKLEIVKPGLAPVVALKRFAVINGQDQPVNQTLLTMPLRLDTNYTVRVDVLGNQFTTWIMDQKLDQWSDDRLPAGGVGWYSELGERRDSQIALSVFSLIRK